MNDWTGASVKNPSRKSVSPALPVWDGVEVVKIIFSALAAFIFSATPCHAESPVKKPVNVLFIVVDDLRPELGCYGNPVVKSPNFDRLAARGLVFNHAYCQEALCNPSRSSLMTGRGPDAIRVYDLRTHFRAALPNVVTLPQYFKSNGYYCAALSKVYHGGLEDGPSWSEPLWDPSGHTIDTDALGQHHVVKRIGPGVKESSAESRAAAKAYYIQHGQAQRAAELDDEDNTANPYLRSGASFEAIAKDDDELPTAAPRRRRSNGCTNEQDQRPALLFRRGLSQTPHAVRRAEEILGPLRSGQSSAAGL